MPASLSLLEVALQTKRLEIVLRRSSPSLSRNLVVTLGLGRREPLRDIRPAHGAQPAVPFIDARANLWGNLATDKCRADRAI